MRLLTSHESKKIDQIAQEKYSLPTSILMENAGIAVIRHIFKNIKQPISQLRITVVAGPGNNGGDGLVTARHLFFLKPKSLDIILLSPAQKYKGATKDNYLRVKALGVSIHIGNSSEAIKKCSSYINNANIIIDSIFGTGLNRTVEKVTKEAIDLINKAKAHIISVDIPSGVSSDSGEILGAAVRATSTVTFGIPKVGHYLYPGRENVGALDVENISLPPQLLKGEGETMLITKEQVKNILPKRTPQNHKGTSGHLLNIAGSAGKSGAAILSSLGAFRIGTGLVTTATDEGVRGTITSKQPEIMTEAFPTNKDEMQKVINGKRCISFGPGIEVNKSTENLLKLIVETKLPLVIDAGGITLLASNKKYIKMLKERTVLTPHPGEMSRLTGVSTNKIQENRVKYAKEYAQKNKVILVLKGAGTLIASPEGKVWVNPTGNVVLATAGTGDVLTGMIAGLITQGVSPLNAAIAAVYIHGLLGDRLKEKKGDRGIVATDLLNEMPQILKELTGT